MLTCLYDVVSYALLGFTCFMCLFSCYVVRSLSSHAYMLGFMYFHVYVLSFYMSTCMFLCLYVQIYVFTCLCTWIYVLYTLYVIFHVLVCSMPCLCTQIQAMFVMPCAIVALLLICLSFLCFDLMVRTRSRPCGLCHHPYTKAHIKGFGSPFLPIYACLLRCFMLVIASLVLGFVMLDAISGFLVVWLHSTPMRPCLDVTTQDASP